MPRRPNPNAEIDKEFWLALSFISDTWNNGPQSMKTTNIEWNVTLKKTIKTVGEYNIDGPLDLALTILVEFFFIPHFDGKHLYEYYFRGNLSKPELADDMDKRFGHGCTPVPQEDGSIHVYYPIYTLTGWYSLSDNEFSRSPTGAGIEDGGHFYSRCLLRLMEDKGLVKHEWLLDYPFERFSYSLIPFESIDKHINEKPLDYIPDPFGVIERDEVEHLFRSLYLVSDYLLTRFHEHPEQFDV